MSHSNIARFPSSPRPAHEPNPDAAIAARKRIADLPDSYLAHATPSKEDLVGAVTPVSPAAETPVAQTPPPLHALQPSTLKINGGGAAAATTTLAPPSKMPVKEPVEQAEEKVPARAVPVPAPVEAPAHSNSKPQLEDEPKPKKRFHIPDASKPFLAMAVLFGLLYVVFKAPIFISQINYLTQPKTVTGNLTEQAATQVPPDPVISIPKINVNAPVVYATNNQEAAIQKDLEGGVVHYANTAVPGQNGNSVIFGHSSNDWWEPGSYKFVFVLLDKLQPGDTFTVNYNSHQYLYQVTGSKVVEPTDLSVLNQTADPEITLITCTPPGTSWKRLVVVAKQISPTPQAATASASNTSAQGTLPGNAPSLTDKLSNWWRDLLGLLHLTSDNSTTTPNPGGPSAPATLPAS